MSTNYAPVIYGVPSQALDDVDAERNAATVAQALSDNGFETDTLAVGLDLTVLVKLAGQKPLAVFNLVDSIHGDGSLAFLAPLMLDHLKLRYTGARSQAYLQSTSKLLSKAALRGAGLPTPDWWCSGEEIPAEETVIVKSVLEHASIGMDAASVVPGHAAQVEIDSRKQQFGGPFFAEAFVDGREFNVSILETCAGPQALPIPEICFDGLPDGRPRIVDYEAKWQQDSGIFDKMPRRFGLEQVDVRLADRLRRISLAAWRLFGLSGYARVDIRLSRSGMPFIIDINANPCLAPDAGFAATAAHSGLSYDALIAAILQSATGNLRKF